MAPRKRILSAHVVTSTMEELGKARQACVRLSADAPINGTHYRAAAEVMRAIDEFAEVVTGSRNHFHAILCPAIDEPKREP